MRIGPSLLASLAALVLGAHCLRAGWDLLVVAFAVILALAWIPRTWARQAVRWSLVLGTLEWLRTMAELAAFRMESGQPWLRMVLILGAVAALTALAAAWAVPRAPAPEPVETP